MFGKCLKCLENLKENIWENLMERIIVFRLRSELSIHQRPTKQIEINKASSNWKKSPPRYRFSTSIIISLWAYVCFVMKSARSSRRTILTYITQIFLLLFLLRSPLFSSRFSTIDDPPTVCGNIKFVNIYFDDEEKSFSRKENLFAAFTVRFFMREFVDTIEG